MSDIKRLALGLVSTIVGFYFSLTLFVTISPEVPEFIDKANDFIFAAFFIILIIISILIGLWFGRISYGSYNSLNWKINRHFFIIILPIILTILMTLMKIQ